MTAPEGVTEGAIAATCQGVRVPEGPHLGDWHRKKLNSGEYEVREVRAAMRLVREGDCVLELGAGIGVVGAVALVRCGAARLVACEANPQLVPALQTLYRINGLADRVTLHNVVVLAGPDRRETVNFNIRPNYLGSRIGDTADRGHLTQLPTADFATLLAEVRPDVILMDIEGAELPLLEHGELAGVRALVVEFHPKVYGMEGARRCKALLREQGFERSLMSSPLVWAAERLTLGDVA